MSKKVRKTLPGSDIISSNMDNFRGLHDGIKINKRFEIKEKLGAGGFGKVFKAFDTLLKKDVALKFLDPAIVKDEKKFLRVKREINTSQKISDERVVKIFSLEYFETIPFLVMEFVEGQSLKELIEDQGRISWKEFKPLYMNILMGVKALHDKGIIHRDLKPSNILITGEGRVKIVDFGLSKEMGDREKTSSIGEIIGTPMYMSPEHIQGKELDSRSDIYQLGLVLYRAISGDFNYEENNSTLQQMLERLGDNSRKIFRLEKSLPAFLKFCIYKSVESDKTLRFASIEEMRQFLEKEKLTLFKPVLIFIRKKKIMFSLLFLLVIFFLISGFYYIKNSEIISGINFNESELSVSNPFGRELFKKDFSPMTVLNVLPTKIKGDFGKLRGRFIKESYIQKEEEVIAVFLTKKNLYRDIINLPLNSNIYSSNVSLLDKNGKVIIKQNFHRTDGFSRRSIFSGWMNFEKIRKIDLNEDGDKEIIFLTTNSLSMFPSDFSVMDKRGFHMVYIPGHLDKQFFFRDRNNVLKVLLIGNNNPFCHMKFVCDLNILKEHSFSLPPVIDRRFNLTNMKYFYMLIPGNSLLEKNEWKTNGTISFKSQLSGDIYIVNKNYKMTIISDGKSIEYQDNSLKVKKVLLQLSNGYTKKIIDHDYKNAEIEIRKAFGQKVLNPLLLFNLYYFAGDIKISLGRYNEAEELLNKSAIYFSESDDLIQRKAELYFLSDQKEKLENIIKIHETGIPNFFGLGILSVQFFRIYNYLHTGQFLKAEDIQKEIYISKNYLINMINIFRGNYQNSLSRVNELISNRMTPFTLSEVRLLYARVVLLNHFFNHERGGTFPEKMKLAEFYFSDISANSFLDKNLAYVSRAYFEAASGNSRESKRAAMDSFGKLLGESRGNFMAKLWLFYDAFIYGKTMELLDDKKEALRGYKLCIKANPYTDLAKRASVRIKSLGKSGSL